MEIKTSTSTTRDLRDIAFRGLFSLIFIGVGFEHVFSDALLRTLMPDWMPYQRTVSFVCGGWLVVCGLLIFLGWRVRLAGLGLAFFLVLASGFVHIPGILFSAPEGVAPCAGMWTILQRSNFAKNISLLGVCLLFFDYQPGRFSIEYWLRRKNLSA